MNDFIIVYSADLMRRIKSRPFLIGLMIGALAIVAFTKIPTMLVPTIVNQGKAIVLVADAPLAAEARPLLAKTLTVRTSLPTSTKIDAALLHRYRVENVVRVIARGRALQVTIFSKNPTSAPNGRVGTALLPLQVERSTHLSQSQLHSVLDLPVAIRSLNANFKSVGQAVSAQGLAMTLVVFLYMLILLNSQLVMSSVAEEKTSRIAELLVATIKPTTLLVAKVLVGATLSVAQLIIWVGLGIALGSSGSSVGGAAAASAPSFSLAGLLGHTLSLSVIVAFAIFFILGFLEISTVYAGVASLINRTEDLGSLSGPLVIPIIAGYMIAFLATIAPDLPIVTVTSFIPLLSPFVMFARMAVSQVPLWQVGTAIALNVIALWGIAWFSGKLYRVGMLLYGRPPKFKQVWEILRSPS
ncbi:MAG TPA: ABC transporter permease [Candidatus Dormibacteraeota bacterium]|nr:ABC transporter permease [Candidatus Dormibacteraeota bacterium]